MEAKDGGRASARIDESSPAPTAAPTPGPWTHHADNSIRVCNGAHDSSDGCRSIAEAEIIGVERSEAVANAKLIAAAPDLLEACEQALIVLEVHGIEQSTPYLRDAIAKAKGDAPTV